MSGTYKHICSVNYNASVANETINLAEYEIDSVPAGQVGGGAGIIPQIGSNDSRERGLQLIIDNKKGTASAYLATAAEIAAATGAPAETEPFSAMNVDPGQSDTFGPFDWREFNLLLRCLNGAHVRVTVEFVGLGIR